jgi:hypothetical protein
MTKEFEPFYGSAEALTRRCYLTALGEMDEGVCLAYLKEDELNVLGGFMLGVNLEKCPDQIREDLVNLLEKINTLPPPA